MLRWLESLLILGLAASSIVISVLDFAGILSGIPFLAGHTSAASLALLAIVVSYLVLERRGILEKIEHDVNEGFSLTLRSFGGGPVKILNNPRELFDYLAEQVQDAKVNVRDLTWGSHILARRTREEEAAYQRYINAIASVTVNRPDKRPVQYLEVMTFPSPGRFERAKRLGSKEHVSYQLKYYDVNDGMIPPLLQFTIIDSQEVIFTFHRGLHAPAGPEIYVATRQTPMVELCKDYFDAVWQRGEKIKDPDMAADQQVLDHILREYEGGAA